MKYAYEDDDKEIIENNEEEEIDENLNSKKKEIKEKVEITEEIIDVPKTKQEVLIDNLLEEEKKQEENVLTYDNLITKNDEELFELYLGKRFKHITTKSFNFAGLILGPIYLFYRKVYLVALVWMLLNLFCICILPLANVSYFIIILFMIGSYACSGMFSNQIILNHVASKIINLKLKGTKKIKNDIKDLGGTNLAIALIMAFIMYSLIAFASYKELPGLLKEHGINNFNNNNSVNFDGNIKVDESIAIKEELSLKVPNNFYEASKSDNRYYYIYEDIDAYIPLCTIEFVPVKEYKNPSLLIKAIANYHLELKDNIKNRKVNNIDWEYINVTSSDKNIYYATSEIKGNMYLLKFMYHYQMEEECGNHFYEVLDSIK